MSILQKYKNKKIGIYGMGITGISVAKTLKKLKAEVFCWDDNKDTRKKIKKLKININKFWVNKQFINNIVISPGIDIDKCKIRKYLKQNKKKIITDLDLFFELNKKSLVIAITGTNGKSTTCKMMEKILKEAKYNVKTVGNIGNPILTFDKLKKKYIYIIEVSSYQLQYSKMFQSRHAAILNISPDHLERHKNITNYIKVKSKIFLAQKSSDYSYVNLDNKHSKLIKRIIRRKKLKSKLILVDTKNCDALLKEINNKYLESKGNTENLAFVYSIAKNLKIKKKVIVKALKKFKGLAHRQEIIFSNKNLLCINDSKATSFDACLQSLSNYNKIYWIVGGLAKYRDQFSIKKLKKNIVKAYIIGKNTNFFKNQIKQNIPYAISQNLKNAVNSISKDIKLKKNLHGTILLSPAAASFDQFKNFEDRGIYFKKLILQKFKKK